MAKTTIVESAVVEEPIAKTKSKMEIAQESIKFAEPGIDKIMDVSQDPTLNAIIERTGGDDFLKNAQPATPPPPPPVIPPTPFANPEPSGLGSGNYNTTPPQPIAGPKSFTIQDPEAALIEKRRVMQQQTQQIHKEISKESGNMMADMLLDGFGMVAPSFAEMYYDLNEPQVKILEDAGKVPEGTLDQVKKWNRDNKGKVQFTKEQRNLVREPLIKVLEIHSVKADPTTMLIIGLVIVCFMMFMSAKSIKKSGDDMMESLIINYEKKRRQMDAEERERERQRKEDEVPLVQTEEVELVRNR
jgi:hypothetical protein